MASGAATIPISAGMVTAKLPISAYVVLVVIVVVIIVSSVFLSIAATSIKKSTDYSKKIDQYPKLKTAHSMAAWGASVGFIGAGLIVIALIVIAIAGGEVLLKSKGFVWIFALVAIGIAIACGVFAVLSSLKLVDSGAYNPSDANMKKGYLNTIWASISAIVATVLVAGITVWLLGKKPGAAKAGPASSTGPATIIIAEESQPATASA